MTFIQAQVTPTPDKVHEHFPDMQSHFTRVVDTTSQNKQ